MIIFFLKYWKALIAIGIALLISGALIYQYHRGYDDGVADARREQAEAQSKFEKKIKKDFKRIEREAPSNADDAGVAEFLLKRTTSAQP